jgi:plastocyanin
MEFGNRIRTLKRISLTVVLMGVLGASLAACGGGTQGASNPPAANPAATEPTATVAAASDSGSNTGGPGQMTEHKVALKEWAIEPKDLEVPAGTLKFTVTNEGEQVHNLVIISDAQEQLARTPNFKKDEGPQTLQVDLAAGSYKWVCDVPGHEQSGMVGTLTVK